MVNPTLKMKEAILFFLIVVINGNESVSWILLLDSPFREISNFVRPIEPINRLIQTQSKLLQRKNTHKEKIERFLARKGVLSGGILGLNTLCRGCSSQTTLVGPQSKLCCVIPFFILIIFRSIIQFLVVLFPLLL